MNSTQEHKQPILKGARLARVSKSCAPERLLVSSFAKKHVHPKSPSRQQKRYGRRMAALKVFRESHASGAYSYSEGFTRKSVRRIVKNLERRVRAEQGGTHGE